MSRRHALGPEGGGWIHLKAQHVWKRLPVAPPHAHTHQTLACLHYGVHNEPLKVRKQNRKTSRNLPQAKNQTSRAQEIRSGEKWKPQQVGLQKSHYLYGGDAPLGGVSHPFKGGGGVDRG